jgi:RNA polymerase-associated protein RTF1
MHSALLTTTGFTKGKPYPLQGASDRIYMTNNYVVTGYGKVEKTYPLVACSDSKFTEIEFDRWKHAISAENLKQLSVSKIEAKIKDINYLLSHPWTAADLQRKLDNQNEFASLVPRTKTAAVGPQTLQREEALHRRNVENRRQNERDVHAALLRERQEKKMRNERIRKELDEEKKRLADPDADAKWEEKKRKDEEMLKMLQNKYVKDTNKSAVEFARVKTDDEVIGALDLGIDVDIF